jgi:CheY-like chemotaxis protein
MFSGVLDNKKILLVEDNAINQLLVQRTLARYNINIAIAEDGKKAIDLLSRNAYDIILMDISLPDMSGYEIVQLMRKSLRIETPVYALTALALDGERENCVAAGMNGYILKPFTVKKLEEEINRNNNASIANTLANEYVIGDEVTTIDMEFLYTVAAGDFEYINLMISTFIETIPPLIEKMRNECSNKKWDELQKTAHYTKSSLSVIKVRQMIILVGSIEWQCKTKTSISEIAEKIEELAQHFHRSKTILLQTPLKYA